MPLIRLTDQEGTHAALTELVAGLTLTDKSRTLPDWAELTIKIGFAMQMLVQIEGSQLVEHYKCSKLEAGRGIIHTLAFTIGWLLHEEDIGQRQAFCADLSVELDTILEGFDRERSARETHEKHNGQRPRPDA
jgi:hypothetical protein